MTYSAIEQKLNDGKFHFIEIDSKGEEGFSARLENGDDLDDYAEGIGPTIESALQALEDRLNTKQGFM